MGSGLDTLLAGFCGSPCCWIIFVLILLSIAYNAGQQDANNGRRR